MVLGRLLNRIRAGMNNQGGLVSYSILKPCYRCVYGKRKEPIIILVTRYGGLQPNVIVNKEGKTFTRRGGCLGIEKCQKCLERIDQDINNPIQDLPCVWIRI